MAELIPDLEGLREIETHAPFDSVIITEESEDSDGYKLYTGIDFINTDPSLLSSISFPTAFSAEESLLEDFDKTGNKIIKISFEPDNGWIDVNETSSTDTFQYLTGELSAYYGSSPFTSGSGRTTALPSSLIGKHSDGNAEGVIQYIDVDSSNRVRFHIENVGNVITADEPDLARQHSGSNIDRGINTTIGSEDYDQFLEIAPSERDEGSLVVDFFSTSDELDTFEWSNPVQGFGFYLVGLESGKRDVSLAIHDVDANLLYSVDDLWDIDSEYPSSPDTQASIQYFGFKVDEDEDLISSFTLKQDFDGSSDRPIDRDIFSLDDISILTTEEGPSFMWDGKTSVGHHLLKSHTNYKNEGAFAAIREDGSVITWGNSNNGGDSSNNYFKSVKEKLLVVYIQEL